MENKVNREINSLRTNYSKELKKVSDSKKWSFVLGDTYESNGFISLKLIWLVCFKLIWSCKHRIWCYNVWFRKYVKLIWLCISGLKQILQLQKTSKVYKQPSRGVLVKTCSKNMQQICRRTLVPKSDWAISGGWGRGGWGYFPRDLTKLC